MILAFKRPMLVKVAIVADGYTETLWAKDLGGGRYQLDNYPVHRGFAYGDIVCCNASLQVVRKF